mmetsp:Transcript_9724/g.17711  ORF Transcript_9724/g.17711 Transcript_9724/m.17711 type:complete len:81 (+) Transcript_9724:194-436(+)
MNLFPSSTLFDKLLGYFSVLTDALVMLYNIFGLILLLPSLLFVKRSSDTNISTSDRGSSLNCYKGSMCQVSNVSSAKWRP